MAQAKGRTTQRKRSGEAGGREQVKPEPTVEDTIGASAAADDEQVQTDQQEQQEQQVGTAEQDEPQQDNPGQDRPAQESAVDLDLARFTGGPSASSETTDQGTTAREVEPSGRTVEDTTGASAAAEAVVLVDMYSITTKDGRFITARKGDTVKTTVEAVERGVRLGMLREA